MAGFEWYVAWRHLRDPERRGHKLLKGGLAILVLGIAGIAASEILRRKLHTSSLVTFDSQHAPFFLNNFVVGTLTLVSRIALLLGFILSLLGALFASMTLFTAISIFGVFLGTSTPVIALSVMSGFEADLKAKIRATKADVVITTDERAEPPRPFTDWEAVQKRVAGVPGVIESMAYIESEVIIRHATNPAGMGIILRGIEPSRAPRVLDLARTLAEGKVEYLDRPEAIPREEAQMMRPIPEPGPGGELPEAPDARTRPSEPVDHTVVPGILLGEELYAHTLRVFLGSDVDVACPMCGVGPTGAMPKLKPFRVAGHFYTGMYEFDSKLAYVSLAEAQKFLGMRGEVTGLEIRTTDPDAAADVAEQIRKRLGEGYEVRSWEELNKGLFGALRLEKIAMFVVLTFIALVASFSIISTLLMLATEKSREIAILKSMGARDGAIMRIFVAEGLYIGLLGLALGLPTGIATCLGLAHFGLPLDPDVYYIQKLPVVMRVGEIALISFAAVALCTLATIYPAFLASRMRPVDGLRYE